MGIEMELRHLGREVKTALELALVALAPAELVERLATLAGLLDAVSALPSDSPAIASRIPSLETRARSALSEWNRWREKHFQKISA